MLAKAAVSLVVCCSYARAVICSCRFVHQLFVVTVTRFCLFVVCLCAALHILPMLSYVVFCCTILLVCSGLCATLKIWLVLGGSCCII
jgi:hypothetical protein